MSCPVSPGIRLSGYTAVIRISIHGGRSALLVDETVQSTCLPVACKTNDETTFAAEGGPRASVVAHVFTFFYASAGEMSTGRKKPNVGLEMAILPEASSPSYHHPSG